jgi:ABC-2 type transport system permease protein
MKLLRLFGASFSLSLRREITFRANLVFQLALTVLNIASGFVVLSAVYTQTQALGGWGLGEAIVLLGTFQVVSGIFTTCVEPNLSWFAGQVRDGKLDSILVQPVSSLFLISLGRCEPLALSQVAMGLLVVGLGLHDGGTLPSWWGVLGWLVLIGVGLVIAWASRVLIASVSLWVPSIELDVLYSALWQFGRYPVEVYRQPLRFFLTYVLPFAFLATFPARALTGRTSLLLPLLGIAAACMAIVMVQLVWKAGLRRYTSATS